MSPAPYPTPWLEALSVVSPLLDFGLDLNIHEYSMNIHEYSWKKITILRKVNIQVTT